MVDGPTGVVSVSFVCEAGRLEAQAVLLAASLRAVHPEAELVAALPGVLPAATERALAALGVGTARITNPLARDYPIGNKLAALSARNAGGLRVFLDSDMLCLRPLDWACLATHPFAAKPADLATFGNAALWQRLYQRFGLPVPAARVAATLDQQLMHPYFNAGMLATREPGSLAAVWADVCRALDGMADINPRRPWLDQIGLPLAVARLNLATRALGEDWNYPAHIKPLRGDPALVHYHLPSVVLREPALLALVARLCERHPPVAEVVRADAAWGPVLHAIARQASGGQTPPRTSRVSARELILTGIPRSGTSYLCRLLDRFDNVAVINEPQALFEGLRWSPEPWAIPVLHADLRARIDAGEAVDNKLDAAGSLTEDTARGEVVAPWRPHLSNGEWVLATKNTLAYLARLDGILRVMPDARVIAVVRHPLDTLASWKRTFRHLAEGDPRELPVGGLADPFLPMRLRQGMAGWVDLPESAVRRAAWWRLLAEEILAFGNRIEIVRYEDMLAEPEATLARALGPLATFAGCSVQPIQRSAARTTGRETLDDADRQAAFLLCAGVAEAFGYDCAGRPGDPA